MAGGTIWDDLLFRAFWLSGWEVRVEEAGDPKTGPIDLAVVAPKGAADRAYALSSEAPMVVLLLGARWRTGPEGVRMLGYEIGILEILRVCEALAAEHLERTPAVAPETWIGS